MIEKKKLLLSLLFSSLLFCGYGTASAYQITEEELNQLETNLNQLEKNNEVKQNLLTEQQKQIETLNSQLEKADNQLEESKKETQKSKTLNEVTQKSLDKANKYLKEYEQEVNHKMEVKDRQLRVWKGISIVLTGIVIKKAIK